jgi:hypothetical protein
MGCADPLESGLGYTLRLQTNEIIAVLDSEIAPLQQVKVLISESTTNGQTSAAPKKPYLSVEACDKIAAAQKKRWAKAKKAVK